jgi:hypothetical protein
MMEKKENAPVSPGPITNSIALIKIEGQEFEIEASLAQDDKTLKTVLQPHYSLVENANITREVTDGKLTVSIVKKAQHKGRSADSNRPASS